HQYLSDRIAPLMFAYSMEVLLKQPPALVAAEIRSWSAGQGAALPNVAFSDLLFHAVRKVAGMAEFELVANDILATHVEQIGNAVLTYCPEEDRELLRQNLANLKSAPPSAASLTVITPLQRPQAPAPAAAGEGKNLTGLSGKVASGLRKLGLF